MAENLAALRLQHDNRVFRNHLPISRAKRHASRDKESREKALLEQRPAQNGQKYINYGRNIAQASKGSVAYISEQERFYTGFADEEKKRRDRVNESKEELLAIKRLQNVQLQEERWKKIDADHDADMEKHRRLMERGAPRNESSVPYDPLTLQYRDTDKGRELRFMDDTIRYRAALRAENLRTLQTKEEYNPITGKPNLRVSLPNKPSGPY